jgi:hypothetical protein
LTTSPSTLRLIDAARHVIVPAGIATTGWAAVEARCAEWGDAFDPWQADLGRLTLGKRDSGEYAAGVGGVGWAIPRQVVKTFLAGRIVFALCTLFPNLTVLWTAHHGKTVNRTFGSLAALADRKAASYVQAVRRGNGDQTIIFSNGSEILFGAREHGFGRGFSEVDIEVFDEAQILKEDALEDMVAATNSSTFPAGGLLLYMGTPPRPKDPGFVFKQRRKEALAGESPDGLYVECSADPDGDHDDPAQWAIANPSYRLGRVSHSAMLRLRKNLLSDGSWRREGLGVWDDDDADGRAISAKQWDAIAALAAPGEGARALGVAFSLDGMRLSLAGAIVPDPTLERVTAADEKLPLGAAHAELIDAYGGSMEIGLAPLADWMAARWRDYSGFVLSGRAGATVLADLLRKRKVPERRIIVASTPVYLQSCAKYLDEVRARTVTHLKADGQAALDDAVAVTDKIQRSRVDGAWSWTSANGDHVHVEAVSLALFGARTMPPRRQREENDKKPRGRIL